MRDITTRADVEQLVHTFYQRIQQHPQLGYIFNTIAATDWDQHLPKMVNFWENILFGTGSYKGNPMAPHERIHSNFTLNRSLFQEWLLLFEQTVDSLFSGPTATRAKERAAAIAEMMVQRLHTPTLFRFRE